MIQCKESVRFRILRKELWSLFPILDELFGNIGIPCIVTCGSEAHPEDDPHTHGFAMDLRSKHMNDSEKHDMWMHMKERFGPSYTVLLENEGGENEHYHIQIRKGLWRELI